MELLASTAELAHSRSQVSSQTPPPLHVEGPRPAMGALARRLTCFSAQCGQCLLDNALRVFLLLTLASAAIACSQLLSQELLAGMLEWIKEERVKGSVFFVVMFALAVVVMFPGAILSLAAGAVFGVPLGTVLVWTGTVIGQTLAFVLGRYLLRKWVREVTVRKFPKWAAVEAALTAEGWKLVTLLRLSPLVPWNVLNYALSVTGVRLVTYAGASAAAILPWNVTFVYFGSLAQTTAEVLEGRALRDSAASLPLAAVSGLLLAGAAAYMAVLARRAIRSALHLQTHGEELADDFDRFSLLTSPRQSADTGRLTEEELHDLESSPLCSSSGTSSQQLSRTEQKIERR